MLPAPLHILIADDDKEDIELLEESFRSALSSVELSTVDNGSAAVQLLNSAADSNLPSLIVLDYSMPLLSGPEVLSIIRSDPRFKDIPVAILSTSNSPAHIQACKNYGAVAYFVKPQSLPELENIAKRMIALCH